MYGGVLVARKIAGGIYTLHNVDKSTIPSHHLPPQPASSLVHSNQTVSMVICTTVQWAWWSMRGSFWILSESRKADWRRAAESLVYMIE